MYFSIGAVLGPMLALWVAEILGGWKQNYIVLAVLFFILLIVVLSQKHTKIMGDEIIGNKIMDDIKNKESADENISKTAPAQKGLITILLLKEKTLIMLCISIFVYVGIEEAVAFWTNTYFFDMFNMEKLGAYALSGYWGSMILGRYIGSKFEEKSTMFCLGGLFISFVSIVLALVIKNPAFNLVCFVLIGFGFSVVWPHLMATAAMNYYKYTGTVMGVMTMFGSAGGIVMPFLMGAIKEMRGIWAAFLIVPVLILSILLIQKRVKRVSDGFKAIGY